MHSSYCVLLCMYSLLAIKNEAQLGFKEREENFLTKLRRKSRKKRSNKEKRKVSRASLVLEDVGSRLYHQKEFMIIISDGDVDASGVEVARRLPVPEDEDLSLMKHGKHTQNFQGLSQSARLDLTVIASKVALSSMKELTSLALDVKGEERSKAYYLEEIEKFIENCKYPGGKTTVPRILWEAVGVAIPLIFSTQAYCTCTVLLAKKLFLRGLEVCLPLNKGVLA